MASGWQSKLARVSRMDWEEVRVRVGQEFHKQCDLFMHRMGMQSGSVRLNADSAARPGQFFFSAIEISERVELLRKHLPDEAAGILREADEICGHRFRLLGYENLCFNLDSGEWQRHRLASRSRTRQARAARSLVQDSFSRFRRGGRPQGHVGIEPAPASGNAGQSAITERRR